MEGILTYITGTVIIVALSSAALAYILNKKSLLNLQMVLSIAVSSLIISSVFPFVWARLLTVSGYNNILSFFVPILMMTAYLSLILMFTVVVSFIIPDKKAQIISGKIVESSFIKSIKGIFSRPVQQESGGDEISTVSSAAEGTSEADGTLVFMDETGEKTGIETDVCRDETAVTSEDGLTSHAGNEEGFIEDIQPSYEPQLHGDDIQGKNILEKSVDSEENIDTMCIDTIESHTADSVELSLNEVFNEKLPGPVDETEDSGDLKLNFTDLQSQYQDNLPEQNDLTDTSLSDDVPEATYTKTEPDVTPESTESYNEEYMPQAVPSMGNGTEAVENEINLTGIQRFIDTAFRLKQEGNLEEAVLNYMYALDEKPDRDLVFWIILDVCVLYKTLGQVELARDILESYVSRFGADMEPAVKAEIEKNLSI